MTHRALPCALLALMYSAAGCDGGGLERTKGELQVLGRDSDGAAGAWDDEVSWHGGELYGGHSVALALEVRNAGRGSLALASAEVEGEAFAVSFEPVVLVAGESAAFDVRVEAPEVEARTRLEGTLRLRAEDGASAVVHLAATAVPSPCQLPGELDFGIVEVGVTHALSLPIRNPLSSKVEATFSAPEGEDAAVFSVDTSTVDIPAEESASVEVRFTPSAQARFTASLRGRAAPGCEEQSIRLVGEGRDHVVVATPAPLDFGYVPPGQTKEATLQLQNLGTREVRLSEFEVYGDSGLKLVSAALSATVPARGSISLKLTCSPTDVGVLTGNLAFNTDVPAQQRASAELRCAGGGPDIEVSPADALDFGRTGLVAGAQLEHTRWLSIRNVGTRFKGADASMNLHFGSPAFHIQPLNDDTTAEEFEVRLPPGYSNDVGLVAGYPPLWATVALRPAGVGRKEALLKVYSDDFDEPEVVLTLSADVVEVPPCSYTVAPAALEFGVLEAPATRRRAVTVRNIGTAAGEVCLLTAVGLEPQTHEAYSVVAPPAETVELAPGESLRLEVVAAPPSVPVTQVLPLEGALTFQVTAPGKSHARVPLSGAAGQSCLEFAPDSLDFGNLEAGCASAGKHVRAFADCESAITVTSVSAPQGSAFTATPEPLGSGLVLAAGDLPLDFDVGFSPVSVDEHEAFVRVEATQSGRQVVYLYPVKGVGAATSGNVDSFIQATPESVDILFSVGRGGMQSFLSSMSDNLIQLAEGLQAAPIPFHLGVVSAVYDHLGRYPNGELVVGPTHLDQVLVPGVINFSAKIQEKVFAPETLTPNSLPFGIADHRHFAAVLSALTPPLTTGMNAGFLRPNAHLMIVAIGFPEKSFQPLGFYESNFNALKPGSSQWTVRFHSVVPLTVEEGCFGKYSSRLIAMSATMGGSVLDLCSAEWHLDLQGALADQTGYRTEFPLRAEAVLSTLTVQVDGAPVAATDPGGLTNWTFDASRNSVRFEDGRAPAPGSTIDISYDAVCH